MSAFTNSFKNTTDKRKEKTEQKEMVTKKKKR
jgi:hypothetical protein